MTDDRTKIGTVTHYYDKIGVGIVKLDRDLKKGDMVHFKGNQTDFTQTAEQMQFDHHDIESGSADQEIGIKIDKEVRKGDMVYSTL